MYFPTKSLRMFNLFLPVIILPSSTSFKKLSCPSTCPSHVCFRRQTVSKILLISFRNYCRTCAFVTLFLQITCSTLLQIHISKASSLYLSANDNVQVSIYPELLHYLSLLIYLRLLWLFLVSLSISFLASALA